jgi:hypothetical protein
MVQFLGGARDFQEVYIRSGADPASSSVGIRNSFPGSKAGWGWKLAMLVQWL